MQVLAERVKQPLASGGRVVGGMVGAIARHYQAPLVKQLPYLPRVPLHRKPTVGHRRCIRNLNLKPAAAAEPGVWLKCAICTVAEST